MSKQKVAKVIPLDPDVKRKPISIAKEPEGVMIILCDDGSIWMYQAFTKSWVLHSEFKSE